MRRVFFASLLAALAAGTATACEDLGGLRGGDEAQDAATDGVASNDGTTPDTDSGASDANGTSDGPAEDGPVFGCDPGPVSNGLIVYFPFDEGSGNTALDCGPSKLTATVGGNKSWVPGKKGGAINFDGTTACASVSNNATVAFTGSFSLSVWVKVTSFPPTTASRFIIARNLDTNDDGFRLAAEQPANFSLKLGLPGDASYFQLSSGTQLPSTWTHVATVFEAGMLGAMYIDGVSVDLDTTAVPVALTPNGADLHIGCGYSSNHFDGIIDEVRIYSRALIAAEIQLLASQ